MITELVNAEGEALEFVHHPATRDDRLIVLGHGVTGNQDRPLLVAVAEGLAARGWPCLRFSYAGNGGSAGAFEDCTISKEIADLQSVLAAVSGTRRVAYVGHSMGGAVGVLTAVRDERIRVLVSLAGMVYPREFYEREFGTLVPGAGYLWDEPACPLSEAFATDLRGHGDLLAAAAVTVPWLLIHGTEDDVVPLRDSADAYAAAVTAKKLVTVAGAGHSFDEASYPQVIAEIAGWLDLHLGAD
jgi:pimeloyl-ACP methyl ester carboxylesterase